jgi:hypothetical protein
MSADLPLQVIQLLPEQVDRFLLGESSIISRRTRGSCSSR